MAINLTQPAIGSTGWGADINTNFGTLQDIVNGVTAATALEITGDLTVNTDTLVVDTTNARVGIGTIAPVNALHIKANTEQLRLEDTSAAGNPYLSFVQAGTRRGFIQLHDTGDTLIAASEYGGMSFKTGTGGTEVERMTISDAGIVTVTDGGTVPTLSAGTVFVVNNSSAASDRSRIAIVAGTSAFSNLEFGDTDDVDIGKIQYSHSDNSMIFVTANSQAMVIASDGDVGIGIAAPLAQLDVFQPSNSAGIRVVTDATTQGSGALNVVGDSLTTGRLAHFVSNSSDASTRNLVQMTNNHASADGTTVLKIQQDGANRAVDASGGGGWAYGLVSKTGAYTATAGDHTILCDATSAAFTITLPATSGVTGLILIIKKTDSSANAITVDGDASETIDGSTTVDLSSQYDSIAIQCDGSNWYKI